MVAPHAGAWIETLSALISPESVQVAPHAGAWIETLSYVYLIISLLSLPMRERGLKPETGISNL